MNQLLPEAPRLALPELLPRSLCVAADLQSVCPTAHAVPPSIPTGLPWGTWLSCIFVVFWVADAELAGVLLDPSTLPPAQLGRASVQLFVF